MKKIILIFIAAAGAVNVLAQNINPDVDRLPSDYDNGAAVKVIHSHGILSRFVIDANLTGGQVLQDLTSVNQVANYPNGLNTNVSTLKFNNGWSRGIDAELGYYFDFKRRFGIGTGFMFSRQNGDITMDHFHVEYESVDNFNNTFRQVITANGQIKEELRISNINIPILFKYKERFTDWLGFSLDAGAVISMMERIHYKTNASFDYEAIYDYTGSQGSVVPVYDNSPTPAGSDLLITQNQYLTTHPYASITDYFNTLRSYGYNVGLGVKPNGNKGMVKDNVGAVGFIVKPQLSIFLYDHMMLNVGAYYMIQGFNHNTQPNYRITDQAGQYNPLVNGIKTSLNNSYGANVGVSYFFRDLINVEVVRAPAPAPEPPSSIQDEDDKDEAPAPSPNK